MKSTKNCKTIAILQFLYWSDVKFICTGQNFPPDRDRFVSMIFTVFWDNALHFFSKMFWNRRQWKLCTWPAEALEIKCVEMIILNLKLNKKNEMFNNKVSNIFSCSFSMSCQTLSTAYTFDYSSAPLSWFIRHNFINLIGINPIRPGLLSRSPGPGGGSEAQMPKIKVKINQLKWNLAWIIMAIKAFLMQNLSLITLLVLEIWRHKISVGRREQVMKFGYLPPENGFNFKKMSFFSTQNWPPCQF